MSNSNNCRFNMSLAEYYYRTRGKSTISSIADRVEAMNLERLSLIKKTDVCCYCPDHKSQLDYFIPHYIIMSQSNLPIPRPVIGKNLDSFIVRALVFNFRPWGPIIINRETKDFKEMKKYGREVEKAFINKDSQLEFGEGKRNRNPEEGLLEFKAPYYRLALNVREKMNQPLYIIGMAIKYTHGIPEEGFWKKIDSSGKKDLSYFFWDIFAFLRWKYFVKEKGVAKVNFAEPVDIIELAGKGNRKEQGQNVARNLRNIVQRTAEEIDYKVKPITVRRIA